MMRNLASGQLSAEADIKPGGASKVFHSEEISTMTLKGSSILIWYEIYVLSSYYSRLGVDL